MNAINFDDIILGDEISKGSFMQVYKAKWLTKDVAVKKVYINSNNSMQRGTKQLFRANHENIIFLHGTSIQFPTVYLVMEYVDGGSFYNFLHIEQTKYELEHVINWALQIAKGIGYLHDQAMVHRDIRPFSILLCDKHRCVKIYEFSCVRDLDTTMSSNVGDAAHMAPEVFNNVKYTEKCDVYSFAITLWEMLSRKKPFEKYCNNLTICRKVETGERPSLDELQFHCPDKIQELMTDCWSPDPDKRSSMKDIIDVLNDHQKVVDLSL
ncbi:mitogen-activated protein kinase kinase kinase 7 [Drosophila montana]|uniref:mitogen-activated protein kinase kinase kinase 7 n=1 Tax=Drosophila montana TaxID=40370 RepID=UPI00313DFDE5